MSKTYIAYDDEKVIIGFENSDGELEYTIYLTSDGGTITTDYILDAFEDVVSDTGIDVDNDTKEIKELS